MHHVPFQPVDYSPQFKRTKRIKISETREVMPTKLHVQYMYTSSTSTYMYYMYN